MNLVCLACGTVNRVPEERLGAGPKCGRCGEKLADGQVRPLDGAMLAHAAANDGLPLVVDFWAGWCGPCRMMTPEVAKAAKAMAPRVRFAKLNTEEHPAAGSQHGIRGIPALLMFRSGREVARHAGAVPASVIERWVREAGL